MSLAPTISRCSPSGETRTTTTPAAPRIAFACATIAPATSPTVDAPDTETVSACSAGRAFSCRLRLCPRAFALGEQSLNLRPRAHVIGHFNRVSEEVTSQPRRSHRIGASKRHPDETPNAALDRAAVFSLDRQRHFTHSTRHAGFIHLVHLLEDPAWNHFGKYVTDRSSDRVSFADDSFPRWIHIRDDMLRSGVHRHHGGGRFQDAGQSRPFGCQFFRETLEPPFREHPARSFLADDEHAADFAEVGECRTVAVGPPHILDASVPLNWNEMIFVPRRFAASHDLGDLRGDDMPDLCPEVGGPHAQRLRVPNAGAKAGAVRVVVDLYEVRPPPQKHRMSRGEHHRDDGSKAQRPAGHRTKARRRPVECATEGAHLSRPAKQRRRVVGGSITCAKSCCSGHCLRLQFRRMKGR